MIKPAIPNCANCGLPLDEDEDEVYAEPIFGVMFMVTGRAILSESGIDNGEIYDVFQKGIDNIDIMSKEKRGYKWVNSVGEVPETWKHTECSSESPKYAIERRARENVSLLTYGVEV